MIGISIAITSSAVGLKIYVISAWIKEHKWIIKKKLKKHDKFVLLGKPKSYSIKVLISKALIDSNINNQGFVLINNMLKEYGKTEKDINHFKMFSIIKSFLLWINFKKVKMRKIYFIYTYAIKHDFHLVFVKSVEVKIKKYLRKKIQLKY